MARRATYIKKFAKENEYQLIVDTGDFVGRRGERNKLEAEYTLKALMRLGIDAIALGERDFWQTVDFLTSMQKKYNLPFVSANIFQPDGKTYFVKPYVIKKFKSSQIANPKAPELKVGIFGLMFKRLQVVLNQNEPQLVVTDPIEAAKIMVDELKDKCDIIVALAHVRYPDMKRLAENVPGIDVIIGCHDPISRPTAEHYGRAIVLYGGNRGQQIGDITLEIAKNKKVIKAEGKVVRLDKSFEFDPDMQKLVNEYKTVKARSKISSQKSSRH